MNSVELFYLYKNNISKGGFKGFENYDIGMMMAEPLGSYMTTGASLIKSRKYNFIKLLGTILFGLRSYEFNEGDSDVLVFKDEGYINRQDMENMDSRLKRILYNPKYIVEYDRRQFNKNFVCELYLSYQWFQEFIKCGLNTDCALFLTKRLAICFNFKKWIDKNLFNHTNIRCLIVRYDACDVDNLLSQYMKIKGVTTITLQHGHFHKTAYINEDNFYIGVPFEGFVSDYFFAWGEYVKREAIESGIDRNRILTLGSLKLEGKIDVQSTKTHNLFLVVLSGSYKWQDNLFLVDCAEQIYKKFGYKYIVREHPSSQHLELNEQYRGFQRYSNQNETIFEIAKMVLFSICGCTTVVSELIYYRTPVFIHKSNKYIDYYDRFNELRFYSCDSLSELVYEWKMNPAKIKQVLDDYDKFLFSNKNPDIYYKKTIENILTNG